MFVLIDLALLSGLLALLFYIIVVTVLPVSLYGLSYILLIVSIVLICVWVMFRCIFEFSDGSYRWRLRDEIIDNDNDEYRYRYGYGVPYRGVM